MSGMFFISNFNQNISNWNVSNVINMYEMFYESDFNNNISNWDVSNVINMYNMFNNSNFNQDVNNWYIKLNLNCDLINFGTLNKVKINSYDDFKQYHRQMILNKL